MPLSLIKLCKCAGTGEEEPWKKTKAEGRRSTELHCSSGGLSRLIGKSDDVLKARKEKEGEAEENAERPRQELKEEEEHEKKKV